MSLLRIGLIVLTASLASADTITTKDSRSWNGTVTRIQGGVLTLSAQFSGQTRLLSFGADYIRTIQFNSNTNNPGAAPAPPASRSQSFGGMIYRRKTAAASAPLSCQAITTAGGPLTCIGNGGKAETVVRPDVVQIAVGQ